ncbi:unnamed protein product [Rhizophagus irregularis]|nr:unnamed protein product [Rhizophagus irregularis]
MRLLPELRYVKPIVNVRATSLCIVRSPVTNLSCKFGKSGNETIDTFLSEHGKWIPYDKFKNIEYLDEGGFGTIYKAIWLSENGISTRDVILKCHHNLNENLDEFLNEWKYHAKCFDTFDIIKFLGLTQNPDTLNYMTVMHYANKGNLRGNLENIIKDNWKKKLYMLLEIISGLNEIHKQGLVHCDFHDGNILNHIDKGYTTCSGKILEHDYHEKEKIYISDLGLCQPVKSSLKEGDIFGVLPFMAPEVIRGKPYTPASDVYSFSMIMWEFTSGVPPYNDKAHDIRLSLSICRGKRPEIIKNTPQCYVDLMKRCWDEDPLKRPSSEEVLNIIKEWIILPNNKKIENISVVIKRKIMEFINAPIGRNNLATEFHPQAYYTSRLFDFTSIKLNETLENEDSQIWIIYEVIRY